MASKLDLMLEAEKRGILPPERKALLDEARQRGVVPSVQAAPEPAPEAGTAGDGGRAVSPPTLEQRAREVYGFDPDIVRRGTILPIGVNREGKPEFAIPQIGVDLLTSFLLPGHVAQGGQYTPEDAAKFALDFAVPATSRGVSSVVRTAPRRKEVIATAPETANLFAKGGANIEAARTSGVTLKPEKYLDFMVDVEERLADEGADPMLHPKIAAVVNAMTRRIGEGVDIGNLHTIRRQIGIALRSTAPELADERRIAGIMQRQLDEMIDNLSAGDLAVGTAKDAALAAQNLKAGKALWARGKKAEIIEDIIEKATRQASGFENGLRIGFRALLNDKKRLRGFSKAEIAVMKQIEAGTPVTKALRLLSRLGPNRSGSTNLVGASIGVGGGAAVGGPLGAVAVPLAGMAAGKAAERATVNAADYLRALAASGASEGPPVNRLAAALARTARPGISLPVAGAGIQATTGRNRLPRTPAGGR